MNTRIVLAVITAIALFGHASVRAAPVSIVQDDRKLVGDLREVSPGGLADGVVLILHGTLAHHRMELIETLQSLLAERGRNTLAITLSLGESERTGMYDCNSAHRHRHTDALSELDAWMSWLVGRGAGNVALLGHSRGGNQAARYAVEHGGSPLKALVLLAPATFDAGRSATRYDARGPGTLEDVVSRARSSAPDAWLEGVPFLYCDTARVTAGAFLSYYLDDGLRDTPSLLPRITLPTLVVLGSADTVVPDAAARTRPHLDHDTTLVVIDGADHFFRDLYADDVADAINSFLEGL